MVLKAEHGGRWRQQREFKGSGEGKERKLLLHRITSPYLASGSVETIISMGAGG